MKEQKQTLPVTRLLRQELTNAFQRLVYETRQGTPSLRVTPEIALSARTQIDLEMELEEFLLWQSLDEDVLETAFESLAYRQTAKHGFRTYDLLHVASALCLGCDTFWSFDRKARKLAELEELVVNPI